MKTSNGYFDKLNIMKIETGDILQVSGSLLKDNNNNNN